MNTRSLSCIAIISTLFSLAHAQQATKPMSPEVMKKLQEAQELQQRQRFVDAMAKLDELEVIAPELPDLYNMRGSIYLSPSLRDFAKASEMFDKAETMQPDALAPRFNKAELLFVKHDWPGAGAAFQKLLADFPKIPMQVRHLVIYKRLVCEVKQDQKLVAEKTLRDSFTFMDDTPAYYYGHAAMAFQKKDEAAAKDWMTRAAGIFKEQENSAYVDTLMEVRWVPNIGLPSVEETK